MEGNIFIDETEIKKLIGEAEEDKTSEFFTQKNSIWWKDIAEDSNSQPQSSPIKPFKIQHNSDYIIDYRFRPNFYRKLLFIFSSAILTYLIINGRGLIDNWKYWYITEYKNSNIVTASATDTQSNIVSINRIGLFSALNSYDPALPLDSQCQKNLIYYYSESGQIILTGSARSNIFQNAPLSLLNQAVVGDTVTLKLNSKTTAYRINHIAESTTIPNNETGDLLVVTNDYTGLSKQLLIIIAERVL